MIGTEDFAGAAACIIAPSAHGYAGVGASLVHWYRFDHEGALFARKRRVSCTRPRRPGRTGVGIAWALPIQALCAL
jgi:hypothetical protein